MVNYATKSTSFQFGNELLSLAHSDASSALPRLEVLPLPTCYFFLLLPTRIYNPAYSEKIGNLEIEFLKK
jgi:hypothetical protein